MPVTRPRGQQRIHPYREIVNAILYALRNGVAWDAIPHDLPPKGTVYDYFRDWTMDGTWKRVHDALAASDRRRVGRNEEPSAGIIDSQTARTIEKGGTGDTTGPRRSSGASVTSSSIRKVSLLSESDPEQKQQIPAILAKGAEHYGFRGDLWTTARVAAVIEQIFGVSYHPGHICKLLKEIGWSVQKPIRRATQRDEEAIDRWYAERWPAIPCS